MLNKIILSIIKQSSSKSLTQKPQSMVSDIFEDPSSYKGWIYPIRYLLALRYLKIKQRIISEFRLQKIYPISDTDFTNELLKRLSNNRFSIKNKHTEVNNTETTDKKENPILSLIFKASIVYPVLIIALAIGLYNINEWHQQKRLESVLANHLPYFSDLLHRKLLLKHNNGDDENLMKAINTSIDKTEERILSELPIDNGVRNIMQQQLAKLKDSELNSEEIMLGFKDVNTLFDDVNIPYYLSPKSFNMPCSSLINASHEELTLLKELESLMSNNNPELCRTTMMTSYKVDDRTELFYKDKHVTNSEETEFPLFHVRRIDKVPAVDGALGLTFKDRGIGSIILVDQIKDFARESVLPALTFQGRNYIIPYWMQGHYDIEEAVTKGYKKDIEQIYSDKEEQRQVKTLIKQLIKDKDRMKNAKIQQTMQRTNSNNDGNIFGNGFDAISVLLGKNQKENDEKSKHRKEFQRMTFNENNELTLKLDNTLYPSIEYHEAYHQIDKKEWRQPPWLKSVFKDKLDEYAIDHTLEELGAYLAQLANTDKGQNIWLSKLLIFSLNPMTQGQAEYYASSIILNAMDAIDSQEPIQGHYIATVDQKTKIFKMLLTKNNKEISKMARQAYQILFQRDVPKLLTKPIQESL